MNNTVKAPNRHTSKFRRTKIIATLGPSINSYEGVKEIISAGANAMRLNFSHGTYEEFEQQIKWIRKASLEIGRPVAIIQDIQGPKIRLGNFEGIIPVSKGQHLQLKYKADYSRSGIIPTQFDLSSKVKRGHKILIYDGKVRTVVTSVKDGIVHVRVDNDGVLLERKGINLPDTDFGGDIITKKDIKDITFGSENDIDFIAQSFVQTAADVGNLRRKLINLGSKAKIIAKIETISALENIEEIVLASDAVMVARGDLSVEASPEIVPIEQRRIVGLCREFAKPVIIATQMLATMTETSEPTRAEVSDVATAAIIGTDCVMLSDETASGKYPIEAVKYMRKIVIYAENNSPLDTIFHTSSDDYTCQKAICNSLISLANDIDATAIVAETKSGATAIQLASNRPRQPIIAVTPHVRVSNQLSIVYGVKTFVRPDDKFAASKLTDWLVKNRVLSKSNVIVTASGKHPGVVGTTDTIKVRVL